MSRAQILDKYFDELRNDLRNEETTSKKALDFASLFSPIDTLTENNGYAHNVVAISIDEVKYLTRKNGKFEKIPKRSNAVTLGFVEIKPFIHPQFFVQKPFLVNQQGTFQNQTSRMPTQFQFNVIAISQEQKLETVDALKLIGLYPAPLAIQGKFKIINPQINDCGITTIFIEKIRQPRWMQIEPMIWEFHCSEAGIPRPLESANALAGYGTNK